MIDFTHKVNARSRSIKLYVKADGEVVVSSPRFTPKIFIRKFVESHLSWIEQQQQKVASVKASTHLQENQILFFGIPHDLVVNFDPQKSIGIHRKDTALIINPVENTQASIKKALERFLKTQAQDFILKKLDYWAKKMDIRYKNVAFKQQTTRWGSCSSVGNLNFNWKLIHAPEAVIEYVIIHELAHRVHMDHSVHFWKLVEQFDPEYRIHRGWLKRKGMALS